MNAIYDLVYMLLKCLYGYFLFQYLPESDFIITFAMIMALSSDVKTVPILNPADRPVGVL